jgi:AcrR family transcriptional regulator
MATATKVIAVLREQGLVATTPGAGTVVRPRGATRPTIGTPPPHEPELTRDRIVRAAIAVADTEGLGALSMRRVATSIGVATMSLYRHVPGKEELTMLMVDTAAGDFPFPSTRPPGWRASIEFAARLLWTMFQRHPWAAELLSMTRPQVMPNLLDYTEWTLGPLHELGLDLDTMMCFHLTVFGHVRSTAMNLHSETQAEQDTGMTADEWTDAQEPVLRELLTSGRYPTFSSVISQEFEFNLEVLFEFGLRRLLDGFEVLLRQRARGR